MSFTAAILAGEAAPALAAALARLAGVARFGVAWRANDAQIIGTMSSSPETHWSWWPTPWNSSNGILETLVWIQHLLAYHLFLDFGYRCGQYRDLRPDPPCKDRLTGLAASSSLMISIIKSAARVGGRAMPSGCVFFGGEGDGVSA